MQQLSNHLPSKTMRKAVGDRFDCPEHGDVPGPICMECTAEQDRVRERAEAQAERKRSRNKLLVKALGHSGIPERFMRRGFDTYTITHSKQQEVFDLAKEYALNFKTYRKEGKGLVFLGTTGTGKNHLAMSIAKQVIRDGYTAVYSTVLDIAQHIRESYRSGSDDSDRQVIALYANSDLLVLDEVGVQMGNESERVFITSIINKRYEQMKPTIVISNLAPVKLAEALDERVMSRLRETTDMLKFEWEDYRARS